jgi:hypothetical protein
MENWQFGFSSEKDKINQENWKLVPNESEVEFLISSKRSTPAGIARARKFWRRQFFRILNQLFTFALIAKNRQNFCCSLILSR